jgi:hypothetical protein
VDTSPGGLPGVVKEIVGALLAGDWTRYADDTGEHFYYIIRERDHGLEAENRREFNNLFIGGLSEAGAFGDWYIRAALAEEPGDRLAKFRKSADSTDREDSEQIDLVHSDYSAISVGKSA